MTFGWNGSGCRREGGSPRGCSPRQCRSNSSRPPFRDTRSGRAFGVGFARPSCSRMLPVAGTPVSSAARTHELGIRRPRPARRTHIAVLPVEAVAVGRIDRDPNTRFQPHLNPIEVLPTCGSAPPIPSRLAMVLDPEMGGRPSATSPTNSALVAQWRRATGS